MANESFDLQGLSAALAEATAKAAERVVTVDGSGYGISGVIWRGGLVVTAHEALAGEEDFSVRMPSGEKKEAKLVGRDPSTDVAVLTLETGPFADWTGAPVPQAGSIALAVGRSDASPIAAFGVVSESGPAWRSMRGGLIDARLTLGLRLPRRAEGGAVVAPDGRLIGLAVTGPRRQALAIPATTIERAVATLGQRGYVARGYLGISLHPLARGVNGGGAIVVGIEPEGPAAKAGLVVGDIITTWNGEAVDSVGAVSRRLGTDVVGQAVTLGLIRGGNATDLIATIGERPRA
ncbi:MAG TPA: S1C family serine protease [Devosiaceae bacterium]|nr:S1C family serine protease [Devosiaceae bacterium]